MKFKRPLMAWFTICIWLAALRCVSAQSLVSTNIFNNWTSVAMSADGSKMAAASFLGGIYTSVNGGTTWTNTGSLEPNRPVLAASANGDNLVAAYLNGHVYTSPDWGASWVPSSAPVNSWSCLAASGDGARLVAGTFPGLIYTSKDSGATFTSRLPENNNYQAITTSKNGTQLVAVVYGGGIYKSTDSGETWTATTAPSTNWFGITSTSNGVDLAAIVQGGGIYTSTNAGASWNAISAPNTSGLSTNGSWSAIVSSADGSHLVAALNIPDYYGSPLGGAQVYISTNFGVSWTVPFVSGPGEYVSGISSSFDGTWLVVAVNDGGGGFGGAPLYESYDSGTSWVPLNGAPSTNWTAIASSADGSKIVAAVTGGQVYASTDFGNIWMVALPHEYWSAVAMSADGSRVVAAAKNGGIFTSANSGASWVSDDVPNENWSAVSISPDGNTLVALARNSWSFKSTDGGTTWTELSAPYDFWQSAASSSTGSNLLAASHSGYVYRSTNAGNTWDELAIALGNTNVSFSDSLNLTVIYTNLNSHAVITNRVGPLLTIPQTVISNSPIGITNILGINLIGVSPTATNAIKVALDINVQGSNVFDVNPVITDTLGDIGWTIPTLSITDLASANLAVPDGTGVFNSNGDVSTNLVSVLNTNVFLNTNVSGMSLFITNVLSVKVAIANLPQSWSAVASSADGSFLAASVNGGLIYTSTNFGATWMAADVPSTNWSAVAISADGSHLAAVASGGLYYTSSDSGVTWVAANAPPANWSAVALSADGSAQAAVIYGGPIYYDDAYVPQPPVPEIMSVARSNDTTTVYFTTANAATYTLYYTNSIGLTTSVTNWPPSTSLTGDGGTDHLSDTTTDATRFYRVGAHY